MNKASGTRERHMERCRYIPKPKAERKSRAIGGAVQTHKRKGDIILLNRMSLEVKNDGWY